ncbi:SpvB/TcaC N-terminal domain-containing protein [Streptomyces sp. NBC_00094]|uniref:SpvB/TcaC N-terminal domain-containing protein n=1 Tax=Streptomyces sp. NBC_00094 TaxID=2903620 RepID=UPI00224E0EE5|nr:SpvB/TcaC N-terminal domain-containing protein [Streptomyces sp. NBC_00094]MCX5389192.1 sugar-binding protein [Streptomyces sp. NBC_00094]
MLALALPVTMVSASEMNSPDVVPVAAVVQPLGGCVPGAAARTEDTAARPSTAWVNPDTGVTKRVARAGAEVTLAPEAVSEPTEVGIEPLDQAALPELGAGMENVTKGPVGYRFTPTPHTFETGITVSLPYDSEALKSSGHTPGDIRTFYFDEAGTCWRALERIAVDEEAQVVVSRTDHFTDMVNAVVTAPEGPDQVSSDPNRIQNIQAASPVTGVNQMAAPGANSQGDARLSYPIELPSGRAGLAPSLSVEYASSAAEGWLGTGWDLSVPSISVDTRWGVPRYDAARETETYLMGGDQLTPLAHRGTPGPRSTGDKVFHARVEGGFERIVRTGDSPTTYGWEVTDKSGVRYLYGGEGATLADDAGNVFSWALREVRDPHGNTVRYRHALVQDAGVAGGTVAGRALYVQRISYTGLGDTDGPYTVTFVRDRELGEARRPDVSIDARGGFKRVTADLLRRIEVRFQDKPVRSYELAYTTGAFNKTLLASIAHLGADGKEFNRHAFEYFDDIRDAQGAYDAFAKVDWTSPDDNVRNGAVNSVKPGAGEAGALHGNTSKSVGGHLYVGYGAKASKNGSVGIKAGYSRSGDEGLLSLLDVDGDSLPDKVFKQGGGFVFRKNLSRPGGEPRFSDTTTELRNLPGILSESANSLTVGVEGYLGVAAQLDYVDTVSTTRRYFSDVNADGVVDLVDGSSVRFGRVGTDGTVTYGPASQTPVPIGAGQVDTGGLLPDYTAERERRIDSSPLVDTVRRWTAPYDGTIRVTGTVALEKTDERAEFSRPDGVRVAVQHEDGELWSRRIEAGDDTAYAPQGVDAIEVKRGERLYFRVGSVFDGAGDKVAWDPSITYTGFEATDANGLPLHSYAASKDFTLAGRAGSVEVPVDGTLQLTGDVRKTAATTDDVTVRITQAGTPVVEKTIAAAETGDFPAGTTIRVTKGQKLSWRILSDSPVDVTALQWAPLARYTEAEGVTPAAGDDAQPLQFRPPYDIDTYVPSGPAGVQQPITSPGGTFTVTADVTAAAGTTGRLVLTVKKQGALLAKKAFDVGDKPSVEVTAPAGENLYVDITAASPELAAKIESAAVAVDGGPAVPATLHAPSAEDVFGRLYRGWSYIGYNGNRDRAEQPIKQTDLTADNIRERLPSDVDPDRDREAFENNPKITPPDVVPFAPDTEHGRWGSGEFTWVAASATSSSRFGGQTIGLPTAESLASSHAVPRMSHSTQISLTGSVGGGVGSVGGSVALGTARGELDYLDMNGDGFPDVVGAGGVQYTDPTGVLGTTRGSVPGGAVRASDTRSGNASAGSAARTIATGRGQAAPPGWVTADTSSAGNDMPPLGIGGNLGANRADASYDLLDINGDSLPDRAYEDGRVALNLGYRFAQAEPWPGGKLNEGRGSTAGLNIGFNTDFYGFGGGASFQQQSSSTKSSLADVNGDGRVDRVFAGNPVRVALNTGTGFAEPVPFHGSLNGINADSNAQLGGGVYFTVPICFVVGCLIINPGVNVSTGASRAEQMIRDIDGDGLADHLASDKDDELVVAANRTGRTNLLKNVTRPLGSRIDLTYTRDGNTYDQPGSRWLLSGTRVHDALPGDGPDTQAFSFSYKAGKYDRLEREFLGYGTVTSTQLGEADKPYRATVREFDTRGHATRGLLTREAVTDASGALFTETLNTYALREVFSGSVFPRLERTEARWYDGEGGATPGQSTSTEMSYDDLGNVVRKVDYGEPGAADDVETRTSYTACADTHIVGVGQSVEVRGGGTLMRSRDAEVNCTTGDVTRHTAHLENGTEAVTDLVYNADGTLKSITSPENHRGQRYQRTYEYDEPTGTQATAIVDSFGYRSTASYDLRFGQQTESADINGRRTLSEYDALGRLTAVTGPHDLDAGRPTIAFEYHPDAPVPYAATRHLDRDAAGTVKNDTIDTVTFTDGLGRVVQTKKDATVGGADVMTVSGHVVFDALGRTVEQHYPVTEPKGDAGTVLNTAIDTVRPTTLTYDVLDRTLRTTLPDGNSTSVAYGFGEDRAGTVRFETVSTDAKGNRTTAYSDVREKQTAVREPGAKTGDAPIWTSYVYDPLGEITKVTDDHGNITTSAYDNLGRRTVVDSPDAGRNVTGYDPAGNVIRQQTANLAAKNQAITYTYDFDRVTEISHPVFTDNDVRYTYGAPGAEHDAAGRVTRIEDAGGEVTRRYGPLGEVTEETRTLPGPGPHVRTFTTGYRYDSFNRMLSLTYADGERLSYTYDSGGQISAAVGTKNGFDYTYVRSLTYDKFGDRAALELGNGTRTAFTYGAEDRRMATLTSTLPTGSAFQNLAYEYDANGNLTSQKNVTRLPAETPKLGGPTEQTYTYDNLNRLTGAEGSFRFMANKTDRYTYSTSYDTIGNITAKDQRHGILVGNGHEQVQKNTTYSQSYAYAASRPHAPSVIGRATLTYDADGNLTDSVSSAPGKPRRQQIWDEENRLACVHDTAKNQDQAQDPSSCNQPGKPPSVRFTYDDQGNRVVKDGAQTTLYPNQFYTARNQTEFKHVYAGGTRIATKTSKPGNAYEKDQFFFHGDQLGSANFGTDGSGRLAEHLDYFPSGETWVDESPGEKDPYGFTGKELDQETGYTYHGARYYDPRGGMWESTDPALTEYLDGGSNEGVHQPSNLQLYGYAYQNPLRYTDDDGRQPGEPFNLGQHLREKYTLHHDQAIVMAAAQLQAMGAARPGGTWQVSMDLQSVKGGGDPRNRVIANGGRADLLLWTDSTVYVWDAKNKGGRAEDSGAGDVEWYVAGITAQLRAQGDMRRVAAGFDLLPMQAPSATQPNTMLQVESSTKHPGKGVITYSASQRAPQTVPVPVTAPQPQRSRLQTAAKYVGAGLLIVGAGALIVGTLAEDVATGGAGIADDPASFGAAAAMARTGWALVP